ncbi:SnoaL-like domain-containing protein [Micromonospora pallida]|uniref:SnoaL-like domain-containing protein n=1 Tax=Micromonospora pallida TaxID=145854 RepID=A0A1C6T3V2_9ACTN|nr:nuclear transport factor 2 family protein [Micromonospora pallida]SCL36486.1 SnoaL-like domain-containing protein [Micromonospora pallida]
MIDESSVTAWIRRYERAWRTAGTDQLDGLFTTDATYQMAPFEEPDRGLAALRIRWDAERTSPDEEFTMDFDLVAVDPPRAVVRLEVRYGEPSRQHFRDLWILDFASDGRCRSFEEWPFSAPPPVPHQAP